jgi:predicted DCC family thiol-disulfide oxidoreductase YuxK
VADGRSRLLVLYDGECGFCAWGVAWLLRWDRARRLRAIPIQSEEGARVLAGVPPALRLTSWHVADEHGRLYSGGAALGPVLEEIPRAGPLAALARSCPRATEATYRFVAERRVSFGRLVPSAAKQRARVLIAARMH